MLVAPLRKLSCLQMSKARGNSFGTLSSLKESVEATVSPSTTTKGVAATSAGKMEEANDETKVEAGPKKLQNPLVWIDLEMTGLDVENDTIIEIACIVTDGDIKQVYEGPEIAIFQTKDVMDSMNAWCIEHHGKSGLTKRVSQSTTSMAQAEEKVLSFIKQHVPDPNAAQLAGNSVHVDRMFLVKHMPNFIAHLSYRIVDVSSVRELARRWFPNEYKRAPRKVLAHTALSDIRESITELKYYRRAIFKPHT